MSVEEDLVLYKIEVILLIEAKYGITIKDEEVEYIVTFEDLLNLIKQKRKESYE